MVNTKQKLTVDSPKIKRRESALPQKVIKSKEDSKKESKKQSTHKKARTQQNVNNELLPINNYFKHKWINCPIKINCPAYWRGKNKKTQLYAAYRETHFFYPFTLSLWVSLWLKWEWKDKKSYFKQIITQRSGYIYIRQTRF